MSNFQEAFYADGVDYDGGSPHLNYGPLHDRLVETIRSQLMHLADVGLPLRVLELGAGHGGFTEPALAFGCEVTAIEMSRPAIDELNRRFGQNPAFSVSYDPTGDLGVVSGDFSLLLCLSVLHHIPDYVSALKRATDHLLPGGSFIALQDPLWYDRVPGRVLRFNRLGYGLWRLRQGNIGRGVATWLRRRKGVYDELNLSDMVEYHVVRNGVDEEAVAALCRARFDDVQVIRYWSNQSRLAQHMGDRLSLANTFGIVATGYRP